MAFVRIDVRPEEKAVILKALRTFRDRCPEDYDVFIHDMGLEEFGSYCDAWDILRGEISTEMVASDDSIGRGKEVKV